MTKKRRTLVRYRFPERRDKRTGNPAPTVADVDLAEVIYRQLRDAAAMLVDPRASHRVRAGAEERLRAAAEAAAEKARRLAKVPPPKVSKQQALDALTNSPRKLDAAVELDISERWLHELTKKPRKRNP